VSHGPRRLSHINTLLAPSGGASVSDTDLLARWTALRDEAAFELLVRRHGSAVLATCRRLLTDANDADDAFQATFLVLARKAPSVRGELLGAWLHRVAFRVALRMRSDRFKRTSRQESGMVDQVPAPSSTDSACKELLSVLDEEVERLPARHRVVFVLCCLEGKTGEEVGKLLGCPPGTVSSRLTRARERIRERLTRRGFVPAVVLAALAGESSAIPVPNALVESTMRAAPAFAVSAHAGPPSRPETIAEGVVKTMFVHKLKLLPVILIAGLLTVGAVLAGSGSKPGNPPAHPQTAANAAVDEKEPTVPVVRVVKPQPGGLDRVSVQRCVANAGLQTNLLPATAGVLKKMEVDLGDRVKAGQLLAEIDAPMLVLDEKLALIGVDQAAGLLKEAEARVGIAKAEVQAAKGFIALSESLVKSKKAYLAYREKQFERFKALQNQNAVDSKIVDEAEAQLLAAKEQANAAVEQVNNAKTDIAVKESKLLQADAGLATAKANVEVAKIGLEKARLAVAQTRIVAPFDGLVAMRHAAMGDMVHPGQTTPLFTIMRANFLQVVVHVPEREAKHLKPGLAVDVGFDAVPNLTLTGKVARVGVSVEAPNQTIRAEIDLPNPKEQILPGMTGTVSLTLSKDPADAVRIPMKALFQAPNTKPDELKWAVYVYKNGKARLTPVQTGYSKGEEIEVTAGLSPDDLVVTNPVKLIPNPKAAEPLPEVKVEIEK